MIENKSEAERESDRTESPSANWETESRNALESFRRDFNTTSSLAAYDKGNPPQIVDERASKAEPRPVKNYSETNPDIVGANANRFNSEARTAVEKYGVGPKESDTRQSQTACSSPELAKQRYLKEIGLPESKLRDHLDLPKDTSSIAINSTIESRNRDVRSDLKLPENATNEQVNAAINKFNAEFIRKEFGLNPKSSETELFKELNGTLASRLGLPGNNDAEQLRTALGLPANASAEQVESAAAAHNAAAIRQAMGLPSTATERAVYETRRNARYKNDVDFYLKNDPFHEGPNTYGDSTTEAWSWAKSHVNETSAEHEKARAQLVEGFESRLRRK